MCYIHNIYIIREDEFEGDADDNSDDDDDDDSGVPSQATNGVRQSIIGYLAISNLIYLSFCSAFRICKSGRYSLCSSKGLPY